ncbi:hypothetical protein AVEN_21017-1 [Araneus ventricosus]|uniref:Uncharacterized protein n=1 Tax=Araneus ventricosus TaxID=182803 RepID=A0A4Y2D6A3_ARAVE|nr:hypothetical protein AVEN_21017-1 [Araneus ventricosus]
MITDIQNFPSRGRPSRECPITIIRGFPYPSWYQITCQDMTIQCFNYQFIPLISPHVTLSTDKELAYVETIRSFRRNAVRKALEEWQKKVYNPHSQLCINGSKNPWLQRAATSKEIANKQALSVFILP